MRMRRRRTTPEVTSARRTAGSMCESSTLQEAVLLDARVQLRACQAEELGGARLVVARLRERLDHERAFERVEVDAAGGQRRVGRISGGRLARGAHRQMLAANQSAIREDDGAFDRVAQPADTARPRIGEQVPPGRAPETAPRAAGPSP